MHWNPRMRDGAEPSINLHTYFGRCIAAHHQLKIKHIGLQNFYGANRGEFAKIFDTTVMAHTEFIDVFGGVGGKSSNAFVDLTWKEVPKDVRFMWKSHRSNEPAPQHASILESFTGLEYFYMVSAKPPPRDDKTTPNGDAISPGTTSPLTPYGSPWRDQEHDTSHLGKDYLDALMPRHGSTLKHLLLSDQWAITGDNISQLVRSCPNLEQLGLAVEFASMEILRVLLPFLPKLKAMRLLANPALSRALTEDRFFEDPEQSMAKMGVHVSQSGFKSLRWIGVGDLIFRVGDEYQAELEDGTKEWRRQIIQATRDDVNDVAIWSKDVLMI